MNNPKKTKEEELYIQLVNTGTEYRQNPSEASRQAFFSAVADVDEFEYSRRNTLLKPNFSIRRVAVGIVASTILVIIALYAITYSNPSFFAHISELSENILSVIVKNRTPIARTIPITSGTQVMGTLTSDQNHIAYTFFAHANDMIELSLTNITGNNALFITLHHNNDILYHNLTDSSAQSFSWQMPLPEDGEYMAIIVATTSTDSTTFQIGLEINSQ